ncbi:MAG: aquaporin [Mycoplasmataceae bacterium]|jgi:aquaporin Z|nr:aquaporin [Mycoplasmataceae bacterium]
MKQQEQQATKKHSKWIFFEEFIGSFGIAFWTLLLCWLFNKYNVLTLFSIGGNVAVGWVLLSLVFGATYVPILYLLLLLLNSFTSGEYFNPAITIGFWYKESIKRPVAFKFMLSQFVGGIFAGLLIYVLIGLCDNSRPDWWTNPDAGYMGATGIKDWWVKNSPDVLYWHIMETLYIPTILSWAIAVLIEATIFFLFMLLVLNVNKMSKHKHTRWVYLSIGLALMVALGIPFTGASMNPIRSIGPVLFGSWGENSSYWWLQYSIAVVGPILGTLVASYIQLKTIDKKVVNITY